MPKSPFSPWTISHRIWKLLDEGREPREILVRGFDPQMVNKVAVRWMQVVVPAGTPPCYVGEGYEAQGEDLLRERMRSSMSVRVP